MVLVFLWQDLKLWAKVIVAGINDKLDIYFEGKMCLELLC
jgi:hypothetical protein